MSGYRMTIILLFLAPLLVTAEDHSSGKLKDLLENHGAEILARAVSAQGREGSVAFREFVRLVAEELGAQGDDEVSRHLLDYVSNPSTGNVPKDELAWIIHTYAREFYQDDVIRTTGDLIRFKTYTTDVPNRENPEFIRQKEYLGGLASDLGLNFNDVGGFIQEIWIGGGDESFGIMSHSDVQPVDPGEWDHDPWSGEVIDGSIWGRGSVDDKGPICAVMYGMRAVLDSGIPLKKKIILLVGTDEESANEDVSTYLATHEPPDETIVVDSNFPVVCAEKGWGGIWLSLPRMIGSDKEDGLRIVDLRSGFSPSIVPEKAVAKLVSSEPVTGETTAGLGLLTEDFVKRRTGSRLEVTRAADTLIVTALGKSVHSSVPATGHNALMDLLVFLDEEVKPARNAFSMMAKFGARYIGFELDGMTLGISHHDDFMGDVTVAADMFYSTDSSVTLMFNFRRPKGISKETVEAALQSRFDEFEREFGIAFTDTRYVGEPHFTDPDRPFVHRLLAVYNSITGENRKAQSIGGGTYAQRIPNAVVFGPALPDEEYLGHQPNEYFRISTLLRNIEILTHTMVEFGF